MNNYIVLDGKKYATVSKHWSEAPLRPATVQGMLNGLSQATFGSGSRKDWVGKIRAPVTARDAGWGTIVDIRETTMKLSTLSFTDHYGDSYTVVVTITSPEVSMSPGWDDPTNKFDISVRIKEIK